MDIPATFFRKLTGLLLLLSAFVPALAQQPYGNEWIVAGQQYWKIPVTRPGMYRLTASDLQKVNFPAAVNPAAVQVFWRGKEQAIQVEAGTDGQLNGSDYVLFYGEGNDGQPDSLLYVPHAAIPHTYFSVFSDTTYYFLTYRTDGGGGKRMERYAESPAAGQPADQWHWQENLQLFTTDYTAGLGYPPGTQAAQAIYYSHYDYGDGWTGPNTPINTPRTFTLQLDDALRTAAPQAEWLLAGRSQTDHNIDLGVTAPDGTYRLVSRAAFRLNYNFKAAQTLAATDFDNAGKLQLRAEAKGGGVYPNDNFSVSYLKVLYPQALTLGTAAQRYFRPVPNPAGKSLLYIRKATPTTQLFDVTDKNNPLIIGGVLQADSLQAVVRNTASPRRLLASTQVLTPTGIRPVAFQAIDAARANYLIITHPALMKPAAGSPDPVRAYAAYRASAAGGRYDTLVSTVFQLYDLFNYGEQSPLAYRRFLTYMLQKGKPQQVFLIGQARDTQGFRFDPNRNNIDMVPNGGWPGSDIILTMGLNGKGTYEPALPIGRLNAATPQTVIDYLNKVREHEAAPMNALWRKRVLHLSGGQTSGEQVLFRNYLNQWQGWVKTGVLGGEVTTIAKKTDEPVEFINVVNEVNNGVSMITFFGHSGLDISDIDIGFVSNDLLGYRNKGRYPLILMNGCNSGNFYFYTGRPTFGQDWINTPDRGAVLFLAVTHLGYPSYLKAYTDEIYTSLFRDSTNFYKPFGTLQMQAVNRYVKKPGISFYEYIHAEQFTLQGDPAVAIYPAPRPDYALTPNTLFAQPFGGNALTAADSFRVGIPVANLGRVLNEPFAVQLKRTLASGRTITTTQSFPAVAFQDTLFITVPAVEGGGGINRFDILLDPQGRLSELNEQNNTASFELNLSGSQVRPVLPVAYGIVGTLNGPLPSARLVAEYTPLTATTAPPRALFELDTAAAFSSSWKKTFTAAVNADNPGYIWTPDLLPADSLTYYWRVRSADQPQGPENEWAGASFTHIRGVEAGWAQRTAAQLTGSSGSQVQLASGNWIFSGNSLKIDLLVAGEKATPTNAYVRTSLSVNDLQVVVNGNCRKDALVGVAFKAGTLQPYSVLSQQLCGNSPFAANYFDEPSIQQGLLERYLEGIAEGDYVLLFPSGRVQPGSWPASLQQKIQALGAAEIGQATPGTAFLLLARKGSGRATLWQRTAADTATLQTRYTLQEATGSGTVISPLIGPTSQWGQLRQQVLRTDAPRQQGLLDVYGIDFQGKETLLLENQNASVLNLSSLDAARYPYLRLREKLSNTAYGAAPQLRQWLVTYKPVAEGVAVLGGDTRTQYRPSYTYTLAEGETRRIPLDFSLYSLMPFADSVTVRQTLTNAQGGVVSVRNSKIAATGTKNFQAMVSGLAGGVYRLAVSFNPQLQPEATYHNNTVVLVMSVSPDRSSPILEVTFDGRTLQNGEGISASPLVLMRLTDDTRFAAADTALVQVFLETPAQAGLRRLSFSSGQLLGRIDSAGAYVVRFNPQGLVPGTYTLRVQGRDRTGNLSGAEPYQIQFVVSADEGVRLFTVYPNPMQYYARFVLETGGSSPPQAFSIEILTVSGKILRRLQAGSLRAGRNEIGWDGRDEQGSPVPPGVYVYRLAESGLTWLPASGRPSGKIIVLP